MIRLAVVLSHPIQYYSPVFVDLSQSANIELKVFYTWNKDHKGGYDPGFNRNVKWDIPLLEGYEYSFSENISKDPGTHHYFGLDNPMLIGEIQNWNPSAILVYGWKYKSHLRVLKHFKNKIPVFFRGDSHLLDNDSSIKSSFRKFILQWVYRKIDYAFYTGTNNKVYFMSAGLKPDQLIFAAHAIDNKRFTENNNYRILEAKEWRSVLSIPNESPLILFAGKLEEKKQPLLLLKIAKKLHDKNIHFLFAGNGKYEKEVMEAANKYKHIHYLPFQNQSIMPVLYRMCDVFCLPSKEEETWGLAVNEAMACGRAVIVSDKVGCAVDLVRNGENGFVFPFNDASVLENIILSFSGKKELLKAMGNESKEIIKNWSVQEQAIAIEKALTSLLLQESEKESISTVK